MRAEARALQGRQCLFAEKSVLENTAAQAHRERSVGLAQSNSLDQQRACQAGVECSGTTGWRLRGVQKQWNQRRPVRVENPVGTAL